MGTGSDIAMQVVGVDDEQPVKYSAKSLLNTEAYQVCLGGAQQMRSLTTEESRTLGTAINTCVAQSQHVRGSCQSTFGASTEASSDRQPWCMAGMKVLTVRHALKH